jgi:hypothetical protein
LRRAILAWAASHRSALSYDLVERHADADGTAEPGIDLE